MADPVEIYLHWYSDGTHLVETRLTVNQPTPEEMTIDRTYGKPLTYHHTNLAGDPYDYERWVHNGGQEKLDV